MSFLAPKLKHRVQIQRAVTTPNDDGGFDQTYTVISTIWCNVIPISDYIQAIRGQQLEQNQYNPTHRFTVRYEAVRMLGRAFSRAFSAAFDSIEDINPLKNDFYLFLQKGSTVKGRRFLITGMRRDDKHQEFLLIEANEVEESGTGWPA